MNEKYLSVSVFSFTIKPILKKLRLCCYLSLTRIVFAKSFYPLTCLVIFLKTSFSFTARLRKMIGKSMNKDFFRDISIKPCSSDSSIKSMPTIPIALQVTNLSIKVAKYEY